MSTSFLYNGMRLSGYDYVHQKFRNGQVIFRIRPKWRLLCCPECGCKNVIRRGMCLRSLKHIPIGFKPVILEVEVPRITCKRCGCTRQIDIKIAVSRKSYTRAFERFVLSLNGLMTLKDIAALLGVSWDLIKDIVKSNLARR